MEEYGVPKSPVSEGVNSYGDGDMDRDIADDASMQDRAEAEMYGDGCEDTDYTEREDIESGLILGENQALRKESADASASGNGAKQSLANFAYDNQRGASARRPQKLPRSDRMGDIGDDDADDNSSGYGDGLDCRVKRAGPHRGTVGYDDGEDSVLGASNSEHSFGQASTHGPVYVDCKNMADYRPEYFGEFGEGVSVRIPQFPNGKSANSTWVPFADVKEAVELALPARTLCWNIPVSLFARHGQRFRNWVTPQQNGIRAANIAAVISFCFTGTSKGFLSGSHEELQRANGEADDDDNCVDKDKDKDKKKMKRVHSYKFMCPDDNNITLPMFTFAYEELYDSNLEQVVAIRVYKFVWDKKHSDSELCRRLMDENRDTFLSAGSAHAPNGSRHKNLVAEQKGNREYAGHSLEHFAGMQYTTIHNEELWYRNITVYGGGNNVRHSGRPFFDDEGLPPGVNNRRILSDATRGGTHPLSPEYVFNARRKLALSAGLVDFNNDIIDVHPDQLDPSKYWTEGHEFMVPSVSEQTGGFFFLVNSYINNLFDVALPRPIYGTASVGIHCLQLYREMYYDEVAASGGSNASASDCFDNMMTERDPLVVEMVRSMAETVYTYDSIDLADVARKELEHYGDIAPDSSYIIEPKQFCKSLQQQTRRVISKLVQPWLKKREELRNAKNKEILLQIKDEGDDDDDDGMDCDYNDERMKELRDLESETTLRHSRVMKDLIVLHLCRLEEAFNSKVERENIPEGYLAMFDGLQKALASTPNRTASIAFAHDVSLKFDDVSSFAQTNLWIGEFWEKDTFVEGRDRRIMDELFLHMFEQYGDVTFLLLLCGYKGNGKTLRTERAQAVFPDNWITIGGPASSKAGMNGGSDSNNGKNVIYDEMVEELTHDEGSDRLEYWKQIVLKREYIYNRTVAVKNPDGTESHRTMKLRTPHDETHLICTNYGMAFTKNGAPSDTKFAMIDRSVAHLVRSIGMHARSETEFKAHLSKPEQVQKLVRFRIFVCLVGATKLAMKGVPDFQPNLALANKMFDYLDRDMVVREYNLPRCTPRKSLKREENLRSMCVMKAVSDVFMFKNTAVEFDAGRLGEDGKPQPFQFAMLYDVIRQLRATPELIFMAWSQSLDYNIGTAAHSFAAMTALCEKFGLRVGDWFRRPRDDDVDDSRPDDSSPCVDMPQRATCQSDAQYENYRASMCMQQEQVKRDELCTSGLPRWLDIGGVDRNKRLDMLKNFERQRRATSLYRHTCTLDGNTDLTMSNPIDVIEKVMAKHDKPTDSEEHADSIADCMPLYSSAILASTVQVCTLYDYKSVVQWCCDGSSESQTIGDASIGTCNSFTFSERKTSGPCKWNTAWLRKDSKDGWQSFAKEVISDNVHCKIFDLPLNGLRDLFYLLSTRDNSRRCTEEPTLPLHMQKSAAFVEETNGEKATVRMRGVTDGRGRMKNPGTEEKKRHPYAMVVDVPLQRRVDFASIHGRLPAVMPLISNNVRDAPPVRMFHDGEKRWIELNTSAALEHTRMLAEASVRCSMHPGMENMQEPFCDEAQGPEGLCIEGGASSSKSDMCTKLPYSYDIVSISLTLDAMGRYYDPYRKAYIDEYNKAFGKNLGFNMKEDDLPHMSLRFVGFENTSSRHFLSMPVKDKQCVPFSAIEVGDASGTLEDAYTIHTHLQLSLGHDPSDDEIDRYVKSRAGSRSMSGVTGDLLSMETYIKHTLTTLKERGMISGEDDVVHHMVVDDPYGCRTRVAEIAGRQINKIVKSHKDYIDASLSVPPDHKDLPEEKIQDFREEAMHRVRTHLYKWITLPPHLDLLREYACLDIPEMRKMTFHNRERDREAFDKSKTAHSMRSKKTIDASSQFKDVVSMRKRALPGSNKAAGAQPDKAIPCEAGPSSVRARGVRDARGERPVRPMRT